MADERFAELVRLACHDLRTPLATVAGFAKTMVRNSELDERDARFVEMIDEAAGQMSGLLDRLGLAASIGAGRYEPDLADEDTLELAGRTGDERISVEGTGGRIETDGVTLIRALADLANAALRFGPVPAVVWRVTGPRLSLTPVTDAAAEVLDGSSPRDLGALVAVLAIRSLGGRVWVVPGTLRVSL